MYYVEEDGSRTSDSGQPVELKSEFTHIPRRLALAALVASLGLEQDELPARFGLELLPH